MGLHRDVEKMLERPNDTLLAREIIAFWAGHTSESLTVAQVASTLHRPVVHVEMLLMELASIGVLTRHDRGLEKAFSYNLAGADAFKVEQFARSKGFHEQKLVRSTDRFRSMYHHKAHG